MAYLGNTPSQQAFAPAVDYFNGTGSATAFTLSRPVASVAQVQVTIENVPQNPSSAFTVSGSTITFTSAPPSGTSNVYVQYTSPITTVIAPGQGTVGITSFTATGTASASTFLRGDNSWQAVSVTPTAVSDQANTSTGYFAISSGTTAQRPASPVNGAFRYNTTTGTWEAYSNSGWIPSNTSIVTNYQQFTTSGTFTVPSGVRFVNVLIVGGGGGGGNGGGGGGGGGVVFVPNYPVTPAGSLTVTVGTGGAIQTNGVNSQFNGDMIAFGGGGGGTATDVSYGNPTGPKSGASGAGGSATSTAVGSAAPGSAQGSAGGIGPTIAPYPAGGGGGASSVGSNGSGSANGNGGTGAFYKMFTSYGQSGWFGGGGAGGYNSASAGSGGTGGGGNGTVAGTANTGGGGGGAGGAGGSGTVIVAWYQ
jgi:hypothetical protein